MISLKRDIFVGIAFVLGAILLSLLLIRGVAAQEKTAEPTLTDEQKLQLENRVQKMQIAELKLDAARNELITYLKTLDKPGYDLNLQTMTYSKRVSESPKK